MDLNFTEQLSLLVNGYIRRNKIYVPKEIVKIMYQYRLMNNIIKYSTSQYPSSKFENITINKDAIITCKPWDNNNDGIIILKANTFINNGKIDCSGNGFYGTHGYGFGKKSELLRYFVGGASYGKQGHLCDKYGEVGDTYGINTLEVLYHGSGTDSESSRFGGGGGGIIVIYCMKFINNGNIICNGYYGGSGGSIIIVTKAFENTGNIVATGAKENDRIGKGGDGRIAIYSNKLRDKSKCHLFSINPSPYCGNFTKGTIIARCILGYNYNDYINPPVISMHIPIDLDYFTNKYDKVIDIENKSGVSIKFLNGLSIHGSKIQSIKARKMLYKLVDYCEYLPIIVRETGTFCVIKVRRNMVGCIIGRNGKRINYLSNTTKCDIIIDNGMNRNKSSYFVITIYGNCYNTIQKAIHEIAKIIYQANKDFTNNYITKKYEDSSINTVKMFKERQTTSILGGTPYTSYALTSYSLHVNHAYVPDKGRSL